MAKKGQKFEKYKEELMMEVTMEHIEKGKSARYLAERYKISIKTIETWIRRYKRQGTLQKKKRGRPKQDENTDYKEKYEILKKYLEFLEEVEREKK